MPVVIGLVGLLVASTSFAAHYDVEVAASPAPPASLPANASWGAERFLTDANLPDTVVASTHPAVSCRASGGEIWATFRSTVANYPALPITGTCTLGADSVDVTVVPINPAVDPALAQEVIGAGNQVAITRIQGALHYQSFALHSGLGYVAGLHTSDVAGLKCEVFQRGTDWLVGVRIAPKAVPGVATCSLPLSNGGTYPLYVDLDEGPI